MGVCICMRIYSKQRFVLSLDIWISIQHVTRHVCLALPERFFTSAKLLIPPCTKIIYCKYISRAPTTTATKFRVASFTIPNKKIRDDLLQKIIPHHFNARFFSAQQPNSIIYGALMTTMATPGSHSAWRRCVRCGLGEVKAKMASDLDDDLVGAETWKKGDTKKRCLPKKFLSKWSQKFSNGCKWLLTKWVRTYDYK